MLCSVGHLGIFHVTEVGESALEQSKRATVVAMKISFGI